MEPSPKPPDIAEVAAAPAIDYSSVTKGVSRAFLANVLTPLSAIATAPLLAHALGVDGRGALAAGTAPLLFASTIGTFGIPDSVTFFVAKHPHLMRLLLCRGGLLMMLSGVVGTLVVIVEANALSGHNASVSKLIVIGSLATLPTLGVTLLRAAALARQEWNAVLYEQVVSNLSRLILLLAFVSVGTLTPVAATVITAFTPVLGAVAYVSSTRRGSTASSRPADALPPVAFREFTSFGMRVWIGSLSGIILLRLDQLIMTPVAGERELGLYTVAASVSELILVFNNAVRDVTFSTEAAASDEQRMCMSARVSGTLCLAVSAVMIGTLKWWLPLAFGEDFRAAELACAILIIGVTIGTTGSIAGAALSARGRPGQRSASIFLGAIANVIVLLVLLPHFGAVGAAWATLVGNGLASNANIFLLRRLGGPGFRQMYGLRAADGRVLREMLSTRMNGRRAKASRAGPASTGQHRR